MAVIWSVRYSVSLRAVLPPPHYIKTNALFVTDVKQPNEVGDDFWQIETTNNNIY